MLLYASRSLYAGCWLVLRPLISGGDGGGSSGNDSGSRRSRSGGSTTDEELNVKCIVQLKQAVVL